MRPLAVFVERFDGPSALVVRETELRQPREGEVAITVHAGGVNFPDLLVSHGKYQDLYPLPFIIGKEGAGVVSQVDPGVTSLKVGDRVGFHLDAGAFCEQVIVPAEFCFPVPDEVTLKDAAGSILTYQTAHFALKDRGAMKPGDWVLVTGASGGVGIATVQLARAFGGRVIAAISSEAKRAFVEASGAEAVIDLSQPDLPNALRKQVNAATGGRGVDLVIDNMGGAAFDASLRAIAPGGRLAVVGFTSGVIPAVKANYLLLKGIAVTGVNWNRLRQADDPAAAAQIRQTQQEVYGLLAGGEIKSPVTAAFKMSDVAAALSAFEQRKTMGKIVLTTRHLQ